MEDGDPEINSAARPRLSSRSVPDLIDLAGQGSIRATARLLTYVESGTARSRELSAALVGHPRHAAIVGLTGPPGVGKSTITAWLVRLARERDQRVAVLAVDPSSPFSGGALLGDRVRMSEHAVDTSVFIRSMSARGHLGGMSAATPAAVDLMSALGFDLVLVETVGVGQSEIDVMRLADTVVVVTAPGTGDGVQAAKAGILEIADLLVVNKADREGAAAAVRDLKGMVALGRSGSTPAGTWRPPVLTSVAATGVGLPELAAAIGDHGRHLSDSGQAAVRRRARTAIGVETLLLQQVAAIVNSPGGRTELGRLAAEIADHNGDPYAGAAGLWKWMTRGSSPGRPE